VIRAAIIAYTIALLLAGGVATVFGLFVAVVGQFP